MFDVLNATNKIAMKNEHLRMKYIEQVARKEPK